jgi:hypothetical protein
MSRDELIEKLSGDAELVKEASECEDTASLIALAKTKGLDLTEEEANTCFETLHAEEGELGTSELKAVSGGKKC